MRGRARGAVLADLLHRAVCRGQIPLDRRVHASSLETAVYLFAVPHSHHQHKQDLVAYLVDHTVALAGPDIDPEESLLRFQLLHALGAWILFQQEQVPEYVFPNVRIELAKVPLRGWSKLNLVGQSSLPRPLHKLSEGKPPSRFRQGGAGFLNVKVILFLAGEALQPAQVLHGYDGGHVLTTPGHDRALLRIGSAIHDIRELVPSL